MEQFAGFEGLEALEVEWAFASPEERMWMIAEGRAPLSIRERIEEIGHCLMMVELEEQVYRTMLEIERGCVKLARLRAQRV